MSGRPASPRAVPATPRPLVREWHAQAGQQNIADSPGSLEREGGKASGRMRYCAAAAGGNGAGSSRGLSAGMAAEINAFQEEATRSVVTS